MQTIGKVDLLGTESYYYGYSIGVVQAFLENLQM